MTNIRNNPSPYRFWPPSSWPLWLVGFRPFFALAFLSGLSLPVLWVLLYAGVVPAPAAIISAIEDALSPFGVRVTKSPLFPADIVALIGKRAIRA